MFLETQYHKEKIRKENFHQELLKLRFGDDFFENLLKDKIEIIEDEEFVDFK
jgi:hypothetical protein